MSGFTKLVPEIIQSSIWNEPPEIRCVWITMLAVKDENGYVQGDERTIARLSNVTIESTHNALELFQRPDAHSKTPDNDGKRIAPAPGGWLVLNHENYRLHDYIQRDKSRERVRRFREKHNKRNIGNVTVTLPSASASASVSVSSPKGDCKGEFDSFWKAYPRKIGKKNALKAWQRAGDKPGIDEIIKSIGAQKRSQQWQKDGGDFIPHPATWLNQGRWADELCRQSKPHYTLPDKKQIYQRALNQIISDLDAQRQASLSDADYQAYIAKLKDEYRDMPGVVKEALEVVAGRKLSFFNCPDRRPPAEKVDGAGRSLP